MGLEEWMRATGTSHLRWDLGTVCLESRRRQHGVWPSLVRILPRDWERLVESQTDSCLGRVKAHHRLARS